MMLSMWKKSFRSIMVLGKQEAMLLFLPMYIDYLISGSVPRTLKRILFFFVFSPVSKKVKKYKNYFFFYPCFRRLYRYVLFLNGTVMLERVVLGCIKVSTGKKGFSLFSTILVKIAQGHSIPVHSSSPQCTPPASSTAALPRRLAPTASTYVAVANTDTYLYVQLYAYARAYVRS